MGCNVHLDADSDYVGWLDLEWRIGGSLDPERCYDVGASYVHLRIIDTYFGDTVLVTDEPCELNGVVVELSEGSYDLELVLLDDFDHEIGVLYEVRDVDIASGWDTPVDLNFRLRDF